MQTPRGRAGSLRHQPRRRKAARVRDYQLRTPEHVHFGGPRVRRLPKSVAGTLVPTWDAFGKRAGAQFKPDSPRKDQRGRLIKYENPAAGRVIIDVPPICQPDLGNPDKPLWITEGAKKADSAASHGLVCVSIPGVWCWRGTNEDGGLTALPDWDSIALNSRKIFLAFDSDVVIKPDVQAALRRLANFLSARKAKVAIVHLPETLQRERNDG